MAKPHATPAPPVTSSPTVISPSAPAPKSYLPAKRGPRPARPPKRASEADFLAGSAPPPNSVEVSIPRPSAALAPHESIDLQLRQAAKRLSSGFLQLCDLAVQAIAEKVHERYGYESEAQYFDVRIGISYRTLRRWLAIHEGLNRLPEADRQEAAAALVELGSHKAGVLAPVLGLDGQDWRAWTSRAVDADEAVLQQAVSSATGARPRGLPAKDTFLDFVLNRMPPERRDYVERVYLAIMRAGEITNSIAAHLIIVDLARRDLADQGVEVPEP